MAKHDWQETPNTIGGSHGFHCSKCDLFFKYNSTRPVDDCMEDYDEIIPCSGGCVVYVKSHKALPTKDCEGDVSSYATMSQQDIRRELSGTEFWNEDKGDR